MRKKNYIFCQGSLKSPSTTTSLFASKDAKLNIIQQLRRGTLFAHAVKIQRQPIIQAHRKKTQNKCWIEEIQLGMEQVPQMIETQEIQAEKENILEIDDGQLRKKVRKALPKLKNDHMPQLLTRKKENFNCSKLSCQERKLQKSGLWQADNPHNISNNISQLQRSLDLRCNKYPCNDFQRVQGLEFENRSLEDSVNFMYKTWKMNGFYKLPSGHLPMLTASLTSHGFDFKRAKIKKRRQKIFNESEGHFIPQFLLRNLLVESTSCKK